MFVLKLFLFLCEISQVVTSITFNNFILFKAILKGKKEKKTFTNDSKEKRVKPMYAMINQQCINSFLPT